MTFDLLLGAEPTATAGHRAAERPLALVGARVLVEDGLLPEVLAALGALVRLLAGVYPQVLVEYGALAKRATTVQTGEGLLVGVDAQMLGEMALLAETFAALDARIRTRLDMHAAVLQKGGFLLELLLADGATDVKGHAGAAALLYHLGQTLAGVTENTVSDTCDKMENRISV